MIIFTEHNEVVMSVAEMRDLIREAARQGANRAMASTVGVPNTFICENVREILEQRVRLTGSPQYEEE